MGLAPVDRQFCATAFSEGLCAVDYDHPLSSALGPLGVKAHNLGPRTRAYRRQTSHVDPWLGLPTTCRPRSSRRQDPMMVRPSRRPQPNS